VSRTNPEPPAKGPDDEPPIERTMAYRMDDRSSVQPPAEGLPQIPGVTLNHEIARGGMGVVYSGRQDFLDRRVAVKLLSRDLAGEKFAARFRREAKILAGIKHAHIVACHSAGTTDDGQSYLVMEFVDGPNLKNWIQENGPVPIAAALRLTRSLAQALAHALTLGVIHRDVKAENILLESITSTAIDVAFPFTPKLVDLGLARMTSEAVGVGLTSPGAVMGTPSTMSPEQFDDPDSVDYRTDIYGLGCVLYEMLVGAPAFRSAKMTELISRKRRPLGPNPCDENPAVSLEVGRFVTTMLASDRDQRPRNYKDLDERLAELLAKVTSAPPPAPTKVPRETKPPELPRAAPPTAAPSAAPSAVSNDSGGPGLLKTAELDFLSKGFPGHDDQFGASVPAAFAPAPSAPVTEVPDRRGLVIGVLVALAVLGGGGVWFAMKGSGKKGLAAGAERPAGNSAPTIDIDGPEHATLGKPVTLLANAKDADNDPLTYSWTLPPLVTCRGESKDTFEPTIVDGLPGEKFTFECAISDGYGAPVRATKELVLEEAGFPRRPFLRGCTDSDTNWVFEPQLSQLVWTPVSDKVAYLSCRTLGELHTMTLSMGEEMFWKVEGQLESHKDAPSPDEKPTYGEVIVRVETGNDGYSLHCRCSGEGRIEWTVELARCELNNGVWRRDSAPLANTTWVEDEEDEAKERPFADVSITRRRDKLVFRFGRFQDDNVHDWDVSLPTNAPPLKLALAADGGLGRFRSFTLW